MQGSYNLETRAHEVSRVSSFCCTIL